MSLESLDVAFNIFSEKFYDNTALHLLINVKIVVIKTQKHKNVSQREVEVDDEPVVRPVPLWSRPGTSRPFAIPIHESH